MRDYLTMQPLLSFLYPALCISCGEELEKHQSICAKCWGSIGFINENCCYLCGDQLIGEIDTLTLCDSCIQVSRPWSVGRAAVIYGGLGRDLVLSYKHGDRLDMTHTLARWMVNSGEDLFSDNAILVPIPLHRYRVMKRKYNQAAELAKAISKMTKVPCCLNVLKRDHHSAILDGLNAEERFLQMENAFSLIQSESLELKEREVILVDDVMTSGATFSAATHTLLNGSVKSVSVLALARVSKST